MQTRFKSHRGLTSGTRQPDRRRCAVERLEIRTLLSGWTEVDSFPPSTGGTAVQSMSADGVGNVYAAGDYNGEGMLREKARGSSGFVTVPTPPSTNFRDVFTDAQGDVFLPGGGGIYERPAGQQTWALVPVDIPGGGPWSMWGRHPTFAADAAGDVFAVGDFAVPTGTTTSHGRTTTTYSEYGAVFQKKVGQTSFTPVYQESSSTFALDGITVVDSGPSAGIYVIDVAANAVVRRSTDGGISWRKVSNFSSSLNSSDIFPIASDSSGSGNVYVAGDHTDAVLTGYTYKTVKGKIVQTPVYTYTHRLVTQRSSDGGATWTVVDDVVYGNGAMEFAIADLNGTVYVAGETDFPGNGIVRSNVYGTWQTVDDTGSNVYLTLTIDPVTGTPYAGGITNGTYSDSLGWSVRSGPPVAPPAAVSPALATFSPAVLAGGSAQPGTQVDPVRPASSIFGDATDVVTQLTGTRARKEHAYRLW